MVVCGNFSNQHCLCMNLLRTSSSSAIQSGNEERRISQDSVLDPFPNPELRTPDVIFCQLYFPEESWNMYYSFLVLPTQRVKRKNKSGSKNTWDSFEIYINARMVFRHCWALHHTWIRSLNFTFLSNCHYKTQHSPLDPCCKEAKHQSTNLCKTSCSKVPQSNCKSWHWHLSIFQSFSVISCSAENMI